MRPSIAALALVVAGGFATGGVAQDAITVEGVVDAPIAAVWKAWTTAAGLEAWLAPHADIDLKVGGLMRTHYDEKGKLGDAGSQGMKEFFERGNACTLEELQKHFRK